MHPDAHEGSPHALQEHPAESAANDGAQLDEALARLQGVVKEVWGFDSLRPDQEAAVRATLARRDALVVLPTGGGKSLCYQAPALVRPGLTVVVSPLISLMKDQIDGLHANGVAAAMLTSTQDRADRREVYGAIERGELSLLFVSPERLAMPGFRQTLASADWHTLAVDEAHCISHWGHDFRPEYRLLGELRRQRPWLSVQAFTATATPQVRRDIISQLGLRDAIEVIGNYDRPNLTYRVQPRGKLLDQTLEVINRHKDEAGIVYCLRRKDVDGLSEKLRAKGVRCAAYHAGLSGAERRRVQEAFRREQLDLVVATVAFGMGIDRPDVRFVVHASLPKGVEQYSQETGRAGRDGEPSECVLFFGGADFYGWRNLIERGIAEAAEAGHPDVEGLRRGSFERLDDMWAYAGSTLCRHRQLVEYFGQTLTHGAPVAKPEADEAEDDPSAGESPAAGDAKGEVEPIRLGCGACDVCLGELEPVKDAKVVAQKILSCVVRCDQRYGAAHVASVLRGKSNDRLRRAGHEHLSTFGLLKDTPAQVLRSWIEQLLAQGFLACTEGRYPTLFLTAKARPVLKGEVVPPLYRPKLPKSSKGGSRASSKGSATQPTAEADKALYERLRRLRSDLARARDVPPYVIFGNATLAEIAAQKPRSKRALLEIKGIGVKKAESFGEDVLVVLAAFAGGDGS